MSKTCVWFQQGKCKHGQQCAFVHSVLAERCNFDIKGTCRRGEDCHYTHGPSSSSISAAQSSDRFRRVPSGQPSFHAGQAQGYGMGISHGSAASGFSCGRVQPPADGDSAPSSSAQPAHHKFPLAPKGYCYLHWMHKECPIRNDCPHAHQRAPLTPHKPQRPKPGEAQYSPASQSKSPPPHSDGRPPRAAAGTCFEFFNGHKCPRGDKCKFEHVSALAATQAGGRGRPAHHHRHGDAASNSSSSSSHMANGQAQQGGVPGVASPGNWPAYRPVNVNMDVPFGPEADVEAAGQKLGSLSLEEELRKLPFPSKSADGKPYKMLLLGKTGSGKSTVINCITNLLRGGTLDKLKVLIPTKHHPRATEKDSCSSEANVADQSVSQTVMCTEYKFTANSGAEFVLIDTPGLADTKGCSQDEKNVAIIIETAAKTGHLNALCLICNGADSRLDPIMRSVLTQFKAHCPDVVLQNLLVVFTNCTEGTRTFEVQSIEKVFNGWTMGPDGNSIPPKVQLPVEFKVRQMYHSQNSFFVKAQSEWTSGIREEYEREWRKTMLTLTDLLKFVASIGSVNSRAFQDLLDMRNAIKADLATLTGDIKTLDTMRQAIDNAAQRKKNAVQNAESYKNFTTNELIETEEEQATPYHNTNCMQHKITCHEHCGLNEISAQGDNAFSGCACMDSSSSSPSCRICKSREGGQSCGVSNHYHSRKKWVHSSSTVAKVLADIKSKYDASIDQGKQADKNLTQSQRDLQALEDALDAAVAAIEKKCIQLKQICSGTNLVDEYTSLIGTLEHEAKMLTDLKSRQAADARIANLRLLIDKLNGNAILTKPPPHASSSSGVRRVR